MVCMYPGVKSVRADLDPHPSPTPNAPDGHVAEEDLVLVDERRRGRVGGARALPVEAERALELAHAQGEAVQERRLARACVW